MRNLGDRSLIYLAMTMTAGARAISMIQHRELHTVFGLETSAASATALELKSRSLPYGNMQESRDRIAPRKRLTTLLTNEGGFRRLTQGVESVDCERRTGLL